MFEGIKESIVNKLYEKFNIDEYIYSEEKKEIKESTKRYNEILEKTKNIAVEDTEHDEQGFLTAEGAFKIAKKKENLKTDYVKNVDECITYLSFYDYDADLKIINR